MGGTALSPPRPGDGDPSDAQYLLDTHIWFWYLIGSKRLPRGLRTTIRAASGRLWISPISVWEIGVLASRDRIQLDGGLRRWAQEARKHLPLHEAALTSEVAVTSCELELPHRDPADRFLAATAIVYELTLLTVDERLQSAPWLPTRSA
ncbi:MAG TPA: type II toxin-antitoxin system VapC family toxin [Solirubrobacteraceae bacterium]|nr:type II toxin-antitoxin system VapC family toxin [Solirubrobacteraceae bacterium]